MLYEVITDETLVTLMLAIFTIGIGTGSLLCDKFSGRHVEIGLVPFGMIGLTLFGFDLALASPEAHSGAAQPISVLLSSFATWRVFFDLLAIGVFGGFYIVPLYVLMQSRSRITSYNVCYTKLLR